MKKCKKRARLGFTITETLVVVAILAFVTAAGAVVTGTVIGTRNAMIEAGDCQSLVSTAILTIADEIRLGRKVEVQEDPAAGTQTVYVDSATFGTHTHFLLENGRIKAVNNEPKSYDLLTEKEYSQLQINDLKLEQDAASPNSIIISMEAVGMNGKIYATSLTVTPINGIK